jgi:nucleoredoxin
MHMKITLLVLSILSCASLTYSEDTKLHPFLLENASAIMSADGKKADIVTVTSKKLVMVYFSAHWCPPCRAFTPELVKFYNSNGGGKQFDIIFVSSDKDSAAMMGYMKEASMPWAGLRWGSSKTPKIKSKLAGPGIPCLVLLNEKDEIISHSYEGDKYVGPYKVLDDLKKTLEAK